MIFARAHFVNVRRTLRVHSSILTDPRRSNNRVTFAIVFINNSRPHRGVQLVETLIMYENKTHILLNRPRSAELDWNRCIRSHACLTNDVATRDDAASTALCAEHHDG